MFFGSAKGDELTLKFLIFLATLILFEKGELFSEEEEEGERTTNLEDVTTITTLVKKISESAIFFNLNWSLEQKLSKFIKSNTAW